MAERPTPTEPSGPVTTLATPIRLDFDFTPGRRPVPVPPRPRTGQVHGPALPEVRQGLRARRGARARPTACPPPRTWSLANVGTVTTYCVVNVPFAGQSIEIPYICAQVLLDGANLSFMGLIQEIPTDQIRMGMRVEAVWVEPDQLDAVAGLGQVLPSQRRARRRLRDLQGVPVSAGCARTRRPSGVGGLVRPVPQRAPGRRAQRGRDAACR